MLIHQSANPPIHQSTNSPTYPTICSSKGRGLFSFWELFTLFPELLRLFKRSDLCPKRSAKAGLGFSDSVPEGFPLGWEIRTTNAQMACPKKLRGVSLKHQIAASASWAWRQLFPVFVWETNRNPLLRRGGSPKRSWRPNPGLAKSDAHPGRAPLEARTAVWSPFFGLCGFLHLLKMGSNPNPSPVPEEKQNASI